MDLHRVEDTAVEASWDSQFEHERRFFPEFWCDETATAAVCLNGVARKLHAGVPEGNLRGRGGPVEKRAPSPSVRLDSYIEE